MREALFYEKKKQSSVKCLLCPHNCLIQEGKSGICHTRINKQGILYISIYNQVSAIHSDPIEKKPLYHFYPGNKILSIGGIGCNFQCSFCQNYSISQCTYETSRELINITPTELIENAQKSNNIGIAYTYNEPTIFYEFMLECAELAHSNKLKNVVVSNGFINQKPLKEILPYIDAFNIDLKSFNDFFYRKQTKGKLAPVLETLKTIANSGKHLEITFLAITGLNDNPEEFQNMVTWISKELGKNTPLHISRYFPSYKLSNPPTPVSTLENFYDIASDFLNYVFLGNVSDQKRSDTYCQGCGKVLIQRKRYSIEASELLNGSECSNCQIETGIKI
ncbi:MAG: AmmeMemoRadiSam system radical SAM enzyme [Mariniphaga sp.]|nr:AmmeMemoRadiSam system radical SAM enzyme [Mariniphaga sp.]